MSTDKMVKIFFNLPEDSLHAFGTESVWAEQLNENEYRIDNSPFYIRGVSYNDIVSVKAVDKQLLFEGIIKHSGHSTYRIVVDSDVSKDEFEYHWNRLQALGCTSEEGLNGLYAIDVPPTTNVFTVYQTLEEIEKKGIWGFEEGHCGHKVQ